MLDSFVRGSAQPATRMRCQECAGTDLQRAWTDLQSHRDEVETSVHPQRIAMCKHRRTQRTPLGTHKGHKEPRRVHTGARQKQVHDTNTRRTPWGTHKGARRAAWEQVGPRACCAKATHHDVIKPSCATLGSPSQRHQLILDSKNRSLDNPLRGF